ncbi:nitrilase-related carbon-nitrogen hydrolase [Sphaerimonospora mesophila]|uniref:nitrilase-related carbon-nitrogen hydrolase n=1 Tax=Sphaerimonospora mesophila TaxID=37483 RepID=UPI0006E41C64
MTVRVAVCQLAPTVGDSTRNLDLALRAVTAAADRGARLVVLPELVTSGYVFADEAEARRAAQAQDGPAVTALTRAARDRGLVVCFGFAELDAGGLLRNSAALVDADGLRAVYRKAHLWDREKEIFIPGDDPPPVVDTEFGRVGLVICYDLEFPEWLRLAALRGAQIVCAPTNWPAEPRPPGERPIEVVRAQASASVNRIFLAVADRTGAERGVEWVAGSAIIGPAGFPLSEAEPDGGEQILLADCALAEAADKRISPRNDVLADRRPHLYDGVARP